MLPGARSRNLRPCGPQRPCCGAWPDGTGWRRAPAEGNTDVEAARLIAYPGRIPACIETARADRPISAGRIRPRTPQEPEHEAARARQVDGVGVTHYYLAGLRLDEAPAFGSMRRFPQLANLHSTAIASILDEDLGRASRATPTSGRRLRDPGIAPGRRLRR